LDRLQYIVWTVPQLRWISG